jgi:hypothetical protein
MGTLFNFAVNESRGLKQRSKESRAKDSSIRMRIVMRSGSVLPYLMFSHARSDLFIFSLLPDFYAVSEYFGLSAFYGLSKPDGFFFEFKYLNPLGTK